MSCSSSWRHRNSFRVLLPVPRWIDAELLGLDGLAHSITWRLLAGLHVMHPLSCPHGACTKQGRSVPSQRSPSKPHLGGAYFSPKALPLSVLHTAAPSARANQFLPPASRGRDRQQSPKTYRGVAEAAYRFGFFVLPNTLTLRAPAAGLTLYGTKWLSFRPETPPPHPQSP